MSPESLPRLAAEAAELGPAGAKRILLVCPPFQHPRLSSLSTAHLGTLLRERGGQTPGLERVLDCTHQIASVASVLERAGCSRRALGQLETHGIVYVEGDRVLNLAVRTGLGQRT